eukprot:3469326-Amphidinium_carterae.2
MVFLRGFLGGDAITHCCNLLHQQHCSSVHVPPPLVQLEPAMFHAPSRIVLVLHWMQSALG